MRKKRRSSKRGRSFGGFPHKIRPGQSMEEYSERNELLLLLGFKDYKTYLRSKLWKAIRRTTLENNPDCYGCLRNKATQVHHTYYTLEVLTGQSSDGLYPVCGRCHKWIEVTRTGFKRTPIQATKELERIHKKYSNPVRLRVDRPVARLTYRHG